MTTPSIHLRTLQSMREHTAARLERYLSDLSRAGTHWRGDLASVRLPWYEIRAADTPPGETPAVDEPATVLIYDEIGGSMGMSAEQFATDLLAVEARLINVRINSPGGSVFDALAIGNSLRHHAARVVSYIDGVAASAASVVMLAGEEIVIMPGAEVMVHDASAQEAGNAADHRAMATFLERQSANLAEMYASWSGGDPAAWRELMQAETWMYGSEAVDLGLATRVEPMRTPEVTDPPAVEERMRTRFDAFLRRYRYAGRAAAPPPGRRAASSRPVHTRTAPVPPGRSIVSIQERTPPVAQVADGAEALSLAAAARREGAEREAHARAQEGRSVPVMTSNPLYQSQLRAVRAGMPRASDKPDPARVVAFRSQLARAGTQRMNNRDLSHLSGYATVYDVEYEMWDMYGPYAEYVRAGAGDATLAAHPDVAFLINHRGLTMARTIPQEGMRPTLVLESDDHGMANDVYLNPNRDDVQRLLSAVDDGLITEESFAFLIVEGGWNDAMDRYGIFEYDLNRGDVSAVNYGANPFTSIGARSQQVLSDLAAMPTALARAAMSRLARRTDMVGRAPVPMPGMTPCPECGSPQPAASRYCPDCGSAMDGSGTSMPAPSGPPAARSAEDVPQGRRITQIKALLDL